MNYDHEYIATLISVFFGQDRDAFGDSIAEVVDSAYDYLGHETFAKTKIDAEELLSAHDDEYITQIMNRHAGSECDPALIGLTWREFLTPILAEIVKRLG